MESGELMLRIHYECLTFNVYKSMHPSRDSKSCMKMEEIDPTNTKPPDKPINKAKGPKKKSKEDKGKTNDPEKFKQTQKALHMPYLPVIVGRTNKASSTGVGNQTFEHHKERLQCQANDDKQALGARQPVQNILLVETLFG
ncbi:hypothetical protein PIB30_093451 [Stylosanthes scabra]|uniref:Uncharacterized protein n=1 Tax=Stylosanthes scabra TaxID=79078 RepID=A0ABU6YWH1_9FABA|nr:hypothetical protein [Stylosanthes scabra]